MRKTYMEIAERWNRCERLLKTSERIRDEVTQPAVNELRYAGRRIADALIILTDQSPGDKPCERAQTLLNEAYQFCMRAEHDCVDAILLHLRLLIKEYDEEYDRDMLHQACPSLKLYFERRHELDELVIASREEREKRDDTYQTIIGTYLPDLIALAEQLEKAKDVLKTEHSRRLKRYEAMEQQYKVMEEQHTAMEEKLRSLEQEAVAAKQHAKAMERKGNIGFWVGVIGTLAGIAGLAVSLR